MFREMHYMDRSSKALDLAEKMADRRRQALVAAARLPSTLHTNSGTAYLLLRNSRWELARYVGLIAKRLRK